MKWIRAQYEGRVFFGRIEDGNVIELDDSPLANGAPTGRRMALKSVRLLSPVAPSKVVCVGKNYAAHAAESGDVPPDEPCLFIKPDTSVIGPDDDIVYRSNGSRPRRPR